MPSDCSVLRPFGPGILYAVESFSDDLACVGDEDECLWIILPDKVPEPDSLHTVQGGEDDVFIFTGIGAFGVTDAGAPGKCVHDEVADRFRMVADNIEIFRQVKALYEVVDHK